MTLNRDQYANAKYMLETLGEMINEGDLPLGELQPLRYANVDGSTFVLFGAVNPNIVHGPDEHCPYDQHVTYGVVMPDGTISPPITSGSVDEHMILGFGLWDSSEPITPEMVPV